MRSSMPSRIARRVYVFLICAGALLAQIRSGALTGVVTDSAGAVIPGAGVTVMNEETNVESSIRTNQAGEYMAPYLAAGRYSVSVSQQGFSTVKKTGIELGTAQSVRVDMRLQVGQITESIDVVAEALQLQTESPVVQGVTNESVISAVPNINSNPFYYAALQAGVVGRSSFNDTTNINSFGIGADGRRYLTAIAVNGATAFSADVKVDGLSVQGSAWNEAAIVPNREGLKEVRTMTNAYSAEYGRGSGVISLTTKSGTNQFHGSAVYRSRNEAFNAYTFENNARGFARNPFKVHGYSGSLGGPIQKNKLFFFVSYEGMKHGRALDYLRTVPTEAERVGDFSKTRANVNGTPTLIEMFNPFTATLVDTNRYQRLPIPGNDLRNVPGLVDPNMLKMFSYYPAPNRTPDDVYNTNNYQARRQQQFSRNSVNSRADYKLGNHSVYGTFGLNRGRVFTPGAWGEGNPFYNQFQFIGERNGDNNPYGAIGLTYVFSQNLVADVRYGVTRINTVNSAYPDKEPFDYDQFGIPKEIQAINAVPYGAPEFAPGANLAPLSRTGSLYKREGQTNHGLNGSMTWLRNRWTHKFGGEYRAYLANYDDPEYAFAILTRDDFTREFVNQSGAGVGSTTLANVGWGPAGALMGLGRIRLNGSRNPLPAFAQKYAALYSQNDWRVTERFQLFLGLRWDLQPGLTERFDRIRSIDLGQKNAFGGQGAWVFPGANDVPRNLYRTNWRNFGPRFGFAWRAHEKTVIRGGYGLTYLPSNTGYFATGGFYGMDAFAATTIDDNNLPYGTSPHGVPVGRFNQVNILVPPIGANPNAPEFYGVSNFAYFPNTGFKNSYLQQWNLTVEHRFGRNWMTSIAYVGSKGTHLPYARWPINPTQLVNPAVLADCRADYIARNGNGNKCNDRVPNPYQTPGRPAIPFGSVDLRSATIPLIQTQQPYVFFGSSGLSSTTGFSNYHSLQAGLTRSLSRGLQINANYVWSKSLALNASEAQNNGFADGAGYSTDLDLRNLKLNRTLASTDVPHRVVVSYVYELPFGRNSLATGSRPLDLLIGGWRTGGVYNIQTGTPILISGANSNSLNGRPILDTGASLTVPKELQRWYDGATTVTLPSGRRIRPCNRCFLLYNPDAFRGLVLPSTAADGTPRFISDVYWYGNAARTYTELRNRRQHNFNMSVDRTFKATEQVRIELSAQATNVLNHTQFRPSFNGGLGGTNTSTQNNGIPGLGTNDSYGTHTMATFDPRQIEFHLRIRF